MTNPLIATYSIGELRHGVGCTIDNLLSSFIGMDDDGQSKLKSIIDLGFIVHAKLLLHETGKVYVVMCDVRSSSRVRVLSSGYARDIVLSTESILGFKQSLGVHYHSDSGWAIVAPIHANGDSNWLCEFVALHSEHLAIVGDFNYAVAAAYKTGLDDFMLNYPYEELNKDDVQDLAGLRKTNISA